MGMIRKNRLYLSRVVPLVDFGRGLNCICDYDNICDMHKSGTPWSMLIVEDELLYLELIVAVCEKLGFEVLSARTVDEGLALLDQLEKVELENKTVDAIWLDHFLPEKNGNDFVKALLQRPEWKAIPIFLVSNAFEPDIVNWYLRAGIRQHFPKINSTPKDIATKIDLYLQQMPSAER